MEAIERLLCSWELKLDLASQNLIGLHENLTYQRLARLGENTQLSLTGITKIRVNAALEAMQELFQYYEILLKTVERARELGKQISLFLGNQQKINDIEQILKGESINLPQEKLLSEKGLLSTATKAITPQSLLNLMETKFNTAKETVLAVEEAWLRLESVIDDAQLELFQLQKLADSLGLIDWSELASLRQKIASLDSQIQSDPLGTNLNYNSEIQPDLDKLKNTLANIAQQNQQIKQQVAIAHQLLQELKQLNTQAKITFVETQEKISEVNLTSPLTEEQISAINQWLTRLESKLTEGLLTSVNIGLNNLITKLKEYVRAEKTTLATNQALLELRKEYRGRLKALKAKALAKGVVENPQLCELAETAKLLLYSQPTPLNKAASMVSQYEKILNHR